MQGFGMVGDPGEEFTVESISINGDFQWFSGDASLCSEVDVQKIFISHRVH